MLLTPFAADADDAKDFTTKYVDAYGETPNQFAADAYDAVYAVAAAAEKAARAEEKAAKVAARAAEKAARAEEKAARAAKRKQD